MSAYPSELRHSAISDRWVLIAPGRAKRPDAPVAETTRGPKKRDPFVPANIPSGDITDTLSGSDMEFQTKADWDVLAMKNAFPFLKAGGNPDLTGNIRSGYGYHELVIHSPDEDKNFEDFTDIQTAKVLEMYQRRFRELAKDEEIKYIQIFTNRGKEAGASVVHPHSQIVALPVIPAKANELLLAAAKHHERHRTDVVEDEMAIESEQAERIVCENKLFVAYCPFAPRMTHHVRILPKQTAGLFREAKPENLLGLAEVINSVFRAMDEVAEIPPYNIFYRLAPTHVSGIEGFRWHVDILPHLAIAGGLEVSTGLDVVTVAPEESAALLREALTG